MHGPAQRCDGAATGRPQAYRPDIDGLRAVAVIAVVAYHAGVPGLAGGFVGVDVFFVLSGFLIGGIVDREIREGTFTFAGFYLRRARRILPALIAVAAATLMLGLMLLAADELQRLSVSVVAALLGGANMWFWASGGYFTPDARLEPFLMTWSLGVEEQFYVVLPPVLIALLRYAPRRRVAIVGALTGVSFVGSLALTATLPSAAFYLLPARAWELGAGVLLALVPWRPGSRMAVLMAPAGLSAIGAAIVLFDDRLPFPGYAAALPTLGTLLLLATPDSRINRDLLSARPMVAIGLISYSWYLWHWPLMAFVRIASPTAPGLAPLLVAAAVSLGLAWLSWRWIEQPFRRRAGNGRARALRHYGIVLLVAAAIPAAIYAAKGVPARLAPGARRIAAIAAEARHGRCLPSYGTDTPDIAGCTKGPAPRVAILGDSHAAALALGLRQAAARHGMGVVQLTKASCPPLLGGTRAMPNHPGHAADCRRFNQAAMAAIVRDRAITTVIVTGFWQVPFDPSAVAGGDRYLGPGADRGSEAALIDGLRRTVVTLRAAGKSVVVFGDVPGFRFDPVRRSVAAYLPLRAALGRWAAPGFTDHDGRVAAAFVAPIADQGDQAIRRAVAGVPRVRMASLAQAFCDPPGCRYASARTPWFADPQHLSKPGADHALARFDGLIWPR